MAAYLKFLDLMYRMEGFYCTEAQAKAQSIAFPTIPQRCNNPGDLIYGPFAKKFGAQPYRVTGKDGKVRVYSSFPTVDDGKRAAETLLRSYVSQDDIDGQGQPIKGKPMTVLGAIRKWAPSADGNDPKGYAQFVANHCGIALSAPLSDLFKD